MVGYLHIARLALSVHFFALIINFSFSTMIRALPEDADWMTRDTKVKATMLFWLLICLFPMLIGMSVYRCWPNLYTTEYDQYIIVGAVLTVILSVRASMLRWKNVNTKLANFIKTMSYIFPIIVGIGQILMYRGEI